MAVVMAMAFSNCNKQEDDRLVNREPVNDLKHSSTPVPFNGRVSGICTTVPGDCDPGWTGRHVEARGNVAHMGKTNVTMDYCMKLEYPSIDPSYDGIYNGSANLIAANGDELNAYIVGSITFVFNEENQVIGGNIEGTGVMHGGTGNFEGAHGFIHGTGYMDFSGPGGIFGLEIPISYEFSGFILYGSEYFDVTATGSQNATGTCIGGGNAYTQTGTGSGVPLGALNFDMEYCTITEFLPTPIPFPFPLPAGTPIGGTNTGGGTMEQAANADNWISSEISSVYRFTFVPPAPPTIINDTYAVGEITGGGGIYEGASGKFVMVGTQSFVYPNPNGATGTMRCIGFLTY